MTDQDFPSMHDVARVAGVSIGTVSNVLNKPEIVAPPTLRRVRSAIDELGWRPTGRGRRAPAGPDLVGVVLAGAEPHRAALLDGIRRRLAVGGAHPLVTFPTDEPTGLDDAVRALERAGVRSILLELTAGAEPVAAQAAERGVAVAVIGSPATSELSSVAADHAAAVALAVAHALDSGRRRIVLVHPPHDRTGAELRRTAARDAVRAAGFDPAEVLSEHDALGHDSAAGRAAVEFLGERGMSFDAIILPDDRTAAGAWRRLAEDGDANGGRRALVIAGHDSDVTEALGIPAIRTPLTAIGYQGADILLAERKDPRRARVRQVFPVELIVREPRS
ncbi:LacI family DNA-binding transcriptional regulator [Microbacterium sp. T32]|uniref:LacI family DNA-binding transcriptional regulator n=2 Tax=Bacillati TaxID=1783272 RepID=UPI0007ABA671|nr:hypothetical protein AVW09_05565 [Microbacterium sp. T32]